MAGTPPRGTATVVLGDVAGSTRLWNEHPDVMPGVSTRLAELLDVLAEAHDGHLPREQGEGDNVVATFAAAADAVAFAVAVDEALATEPWPEDLTLAMRIGLHTGDVVWREDIGYLGPTFNRCARLRDLGRARMILLSQTTRDIVARSLPVGTTLEDLGSHQLRDLSSSEPVHLLRHAGTPGDFPPLKSVSVLPNNLPVPVTTLFGREEEIEDVARALAEHRLVTLTGAGGSGKTRLAQHVASELLSHAPDGVWWVDLMPVTDDARVPVVIGEAVGVTEVVPSARADGVVAAGIGEQRLLLVVDNCEHVVDAVADTVEVLLRRCPNVRVLATSRETLDVPGERGIRVRPLAVPAGDDVGLDDLRERPATSLFLDRAATLDPTTLDAGQRRAVAEVCRRLDGMPLAIELAAARTRLLSVTEILAGLDDRFGLLRAGGRRARRQGSRQRTLEASIAWSYDLLEDDEAAMLRRLGVFPGAFDLEGAREVGAPGDAVGAMDLLSALVDKSLVTVRPAEDGRRYRLLESIRHYALDRLREHDEEVTAREAHLGYALARAAALGSAHGRMPISMSGGPLQPALLEDLRAADETAWRLDRPGAAVDLWFPLFFPLLLGSGYPAALASVLEVIEQGHRVSPGELARAYTLALSFLNNRFEFDRVVELAEPAVAAGRAVEAEDGGMAYASARCSLSFALAYGGHPGGDEHARASLAIVEALAERTGANDSLVGTIPFTALALASAGDEATALALLERAVALAEADGFHHLGAWSANLRVIHAMRVGRPADELRDLVADAEARIPADAPRMITHLAIAAAPWACLLRGDGDGLWRWVERGLANAGPPGSGSHALMTVARCLGAVADGDVESLVRWGREAMTVLDRTDNRWWQLNARLVVMAGLVRAGDPRAGAAVADVLERSEPGRWVFLTNFARGFVARHHVAEGRPDQALAEVAAAAAAEQAHGSWVLEQSLPPAAAALHALGRHEAAAVALGACAGRRERTGWTDLHADLTTATTTTVRQELDEAFEGAFARGHAMTDEQTRAWLLAPDDDAAAQARAVSGWGALTPAELDVARRVADGLTNREVGEALFVSENTVKTHLKSVYAKLDIGSRAELAVAVATQDA